MEKEFQVYGTITIQVELDINANSEEDAIEQAKEILKDDYNLNVIGYHHVPEDDVEIELTAIEYND
jgi:hypothetical protein